MGDLFEDHIETNANNQDHMPLAEKVRPCSMDKFFGQDHLTSKGKPLREIIEKGVLHSMVFWGPPGTGKTTLAKLISLKLKANFISLSAVMAGVGDIRKTVKEAKELRAKTGNATVLFLDEIHRFNKSQQDAFLPYLEDGTLTLIGATTENPSFQLNNALLSRLRVYILKQLTESSMKLVLSNALPELGQSKTPLQLEDQALNLIAAAADGDARKGLNILELAFAFLMTRDNPSNIIKLNDINEVLGSEIRRFDNKGEQFYDQISALHKSIRGSDPDASLYWLMRMLDGGCDAQYIARRMIRVASEDIGNADPRALRVTLDAWECLERLGSPEGELALSQAIIYLSCAPKSNAVYKASKLAMDDVRLFGSMEVPKKLRNAPTKLMKEMEYGDGYRYAHNEKDGIVYGEKYFPDDMEKRKYYHPVDRGLEIKIKDKLNKIEEMARKKA
ncbi:replication-associated recombination protein A [Woeseiaceae bacterium]|jgi:putative ATPase|nr:replication-associated recombination protein A [Woeseiaceae bacterium]